MYKLITVDGPDAETFLQGQLTQDVSRLAGEGRLLAAWCNPKGRVIAVVRLVYIDPAIGLLVPDSLAEKVVARLTMYRLRARADIVLTDDDGGAWLDESDTDPGTLIRAGIAHIDAGNTESFTPHMLNLDRLDAISFTKGCYTGQEIVARTEHRGKSRRRMMRYTADSDGLLPGQSLTDGERKVGEIVNVSGRDLLAVSPVDMHGQTLQSEGIAVRPEGLPYDL